MHLAFITNLYPPYIIGGNEMLCDEVVTTLRSRGHVVSVLCGAGRMLPQDRNLLGALEIDLDRKDEIFLGARLPAPWEAFKLHAFSPSSYRTTRRWLRDQRPDVVVVWNLYMASLAPLVAARRSGAPVVVHVCDKWMYYGLYDLAALLRPVVPWKRVALALARVTLQPLLRYLARPQRIVAISRFMKDFYVGAGIAPEIIEVIRLGVATSEFSAVSQSIAHDGKPLRLLYVGSLWEGKGPHIAVRALSRLMQSGVDAHLDLCGQGTEQYVAFLRGVCAEEGVVERVTLHGHLDRDTVRRFYQSHDILIFPSQWDEPFAAVPVEAMSCGMAIVATTAGGTPEAVTDGETGLLVPPGNANALALALLRLARDPALRRKLGFRAAQVARERFDFARYVDRLEVFYSDCRSARHSHLPPGRKS